MNSSKLEESTFVMAQSVNNAASLVFLMQAGFTMLETGSVRERNVRSIISKNVIELGVGAIVYYLWGYAFAGAGMNNNDFIGSSSFAVSAGDFAKWLTCWVFAVASSTIPSGSMSERACLEGYIILSAFVHSWIYPVYYHWVFNGWLLRSFGDSAYVGFMDFSGSSYVHSIGGTVALTGSVFLGARLGRFNSDGRPVQRGFKPYSYSLIGLGCLLLWTGWYSFNSLGLSLSLHLSVDDAMVITARSSLVTTMGGAAGVLGATLYSRVTRKSYDFDSVINGALAGLVAVTAGSVIIQPWAGIILGLLGGIVYELSSIFLVSKGIDDPVNASPVHLFAGLLGTIGVGFFAHPDYVTKVYQKTGGGLVYCAVTEGCGLVFAQQVVGSLIAVAWAAANSAVLIWALSRFGLMRVDLADEMAGLDSVTHGGSVNMTPATAVAVSAMPVFRFSQQTQPDQQQHQPSSNQDLLAQMQSLQQRFAPQSSHLPLSSTEVQVKA